MRENNRNSIEKCRKKLPQFTTMNVIDGQAGLVFYSSLIFYSLTIDNILNIVVLLILAAVSISMLGGENGIITQAIKAKAETDIADEKERVQLAAVAAAGNDKWGTITEENLANELTKNIGTRDEDYTLSKEGESFLVTYTDSNRSYLVDANGNIIEAVKREGLKVGDYINYIPDANTEGYTADKLTEAITGYTDNTSTITQDPQYAKDGTGMTWKILRIYADGRIDIIGSPTIQGITLFGATGYHNGVTVLNDICETLYSKGNIKARSVQYEDLEYWLTDEGKAIRDAYSSYSGGPTYGHTQTNIKNRRYPNLYEQEIGSKIDSGLSGLTAGIDKEDGNITGLKISDEGTASGITQANSSLTVTQTYWCGSINSINFGEGYNALETSNKEYWISSRCVYCTEFDKASFSLWSNYKSDIIGRAVYLFTSGGGETGRRCFLRPVVTLPSSVQIETCTGTNNVDNMHEITQY